jgi:hypothetical protein
MTLVVEKGCPDFPHYQTPEALSLLAAARSNALH